MNLSKKTTLGYLVIVSLVLVMGLVGLNASNQIAKSFEGGEEDIRDIIQSANEVSSYIKRAEGHMMLYLALHDETDKEKFFKRVESLDEQIEILDEKIRDTESRRILDEIKITSVEILPLGQALIEAHEKDMEIYGTFQFENHSQLIRDFNDASSTIRRDGVELAHKETDFLNKQAAITAATDASSYVKRAEGHLILYLTLHNATDKEKFLGRMDSLEEQIEILEERTSDPKARELLVDIKSDSIKIIPLSQKLIDVHDSDINEKGSFEIEKYGAMIREFHDAMSSVRKNSVELANLNNDLEFNRQKEVKDKANEIQWNTLVIMIVAIVSAVLLGFNISKSITNPINELKDNVKLIGKGNLDVNLDIRTGDEIQELAVEFNNMVDKLKESQERVKEREKELQKSKAQLEIRVEERTSSLKEVNEKLQMEIDERVKAQKTINEYVKKLEDSNSIKDLFIDILRHDLLNPLGIINSMLEMKLENSPKDQDLKRIFDQTNSAIELIENATLLSHLESLTNFRTVRLDLKDVIERVALNLSPMFEAADMDLLNNVNENIIVAANPMIEHLFENILSNTVKYASDGKMVIIDSQETSQNYMIYIKDFGPGISEMDKQEIFNRFERKYKGDVKGSGIGLAIVKRLARIHGGNVWVEDNPEGGAVFVVELPKTQRPQGAA